MLALVARLSRQGEMAAGLLRAGTSRAAIRSHRRFRGGRAISGGWEFRKPPARHGPSQRAGQAWNMINRKEEEVDNDAKAKAVETAINAFPADKPETQLFELLLALAYWARIRGVDFTAVAPEVDLSEHR